MLNIKQLLNELDGELSIDHSYKNLWTELLEEDDDPRDAYVRQMYSKKNEDIYGVTGNFKSYNATTQYEPLVEEDYYEYEA